MMARSYGRLHCLWHWRPQSASCHVIPTPWVTPPSIAFVATGGGGKNYLPFHQPHSCKFMPHANHQQIWLIALPVALTPPIRLLPCHPNTIGNAPYVRFFRNRGGGVSNWGGSADVIKQKCFFYTWQSTGMRLIALPVELSPPFWFMPFHPNTMGDSPYVRFCWNQRWRRVIGEVLLMYLKSIFLHTTIICRSPDNHSSWWSSTLSSSHNNQPILWYNGELI